MFPCRLKKNFCLARTKIFVTSKLCNGKAIKKSIILCLTYIRLNKLSSKLIILIYWSQHEISRFGEVSTRSYFPLPALNIAFLGGKHSFSMQAIQLFQAANLKWTMPLRTNNSNIMDELPSVYFIEKKLMLKCLLRKAQLFDEFVKCLAVQSCLS